MIMQAGGLQLTSNRNSEGGVYLNVYEGRRGRKLLAEVELTPKQAKKLARKLEKYARKAEAK